MCKLPPEATFISNLGAFSPKKDKECKDQIFSGSLICTCLYFHPLGQNIYTLGLVYQTCVGTRANLSAGVMVPKDTRAIYENSKYGQSQHMTQQVMINEADPH